MARTIVELSFELDAITDALEDIQSVHNALTKRHGEVYRRLECDIETLLDHIGTLPELEYLGDGVFIVRPPAEVTKILLRARQLRLIA